MRGIKMELMNKYFELQKEIYNYFGYKEDWVVMPIGGAGLEYYWAFDESEDKFVRFAETKEQLDSDGNFYENSIYHQRFLSKWVYKGRDYTMVCVDTHTDGNKFLQIFDNSKYCGIVKE
jgi:hypothetical protein